jgi:hypothetical protein
MGATLIELFLSDAWLGKSPDSLYWQSGMPVHFSYNAIGGGIAWRNDRFRLGYRYDGRASIDATAMIDEDRWRKGERSCKSGCGRFYGNGAANSLFATYTPRYGPWFLEVGPAFTRLNWSETATIGCDTKVNLPFTGGWRPGILVGAGYQFKNVGLSINWMSIDAHGGPYPPGIYRGMLAAELRLAF